MTEKTTGINMNDEYHLKRVAVRLTQESVLTSKDAIKTPEDAIRLIGKDMQSLDREYICIANLTSSGVPINYSYVGTGTLDTCLLHPREIFKSSILSNAASVIMVHNHPYSTVQPSSYDINATEVLVRAGKILGIPLKDHLIVSSGTEEQSYYSFAEHGLIEGFKNEGIVRGSADPWDMVGQETTGYTTNADKLRKITSDLERGIKDLFESKKYTEYLDVVSRFTNYSPSNCLLIAMQCPEATYVAGYTDWRKKFDRQVNKGEKAITIIAPCFSKKKKRSENN